MVAVIRMGREFGYAKLEASVGRRWSWAATDVAAIRHLLMTDQLQHAVGRADRDRRSVRLRTPAANHDSSTTSCSPVTAIEVQA